jgi:hypothetical protein
MNMRRYDTSRTPAPMPPITPSPAASAAPEAARRQEGGGRVRKEGFSRYPAAAPTSRQARTGAAQPPAGLLPCAWPPSTRPAPPTAPRTLADADALAGGVERADVGAHHQAAREADAVAGLGAVAVVGAQDDVHGARQRAAGDLKWGRARGVRKGGAAGSGGPHRAQARREACGWHSTCVLPRPAPPGAHLVDILLHLDALPVHKHALVAVQGPQVPLGGRGEGGRGRSGSAGAQPWRGGPGGWGPGRARARAQRAVGARARAGGGRTRASGAAAAASRQAAAGRRAGFELRRGGSGGGPPPPPPPGPPQASRPATPPARARPLTCCRTSTRGTAAAWCTCTAAPRR